MANDITGINSTKTGQSNSKASQRINNEAASSSAADRSSENSADKVSLTNTASKLKDIERNLAGNSPVNAQRVKDVQTALANGEYKVDSTRVADKMIDFETSLHK